MPAISDVTIINGALSKIGIGRLLTRGEDSVQSILADDTYDHLLDTVLSDAEWDFAIKRQELSANTTSPVYEHDNAFDLPGDPYCLRALEIINLEDSLWRVEGRQIVTSLGAPLLLKCLARITTEADYSPQFVEAFQARLAMEWAEPLQRNTTVTELMSKLYASKIIAARSIEAGSSGLHEALHDGTWVTGRL